MRSGDLVAAAEPDRRGPQACEDDAEPVHHRHHDARGDHGRLEHAAADEGPPLPGPADEAAAGDGLGSAGILITGSTTTAGEARLLLGAAGTGGAGAARDGPAAEALP